SGRRDVGGEGRGRGKLGSGAPRRCGHSAPAGERQRTGRQQYQPAAAAGSRDFGARDRQTHYRAADVARHAAKRGRARATRDRRIRDLEPGGVAVDQDHRGKPDPLEEGARRPESSRLRRGPPLARSRRLRPALFFATSAARDRRPLSMKKAPLAKANGAKSREETPKRGGAVGDLPTAITDR